MKKQFKYGYAFLLLSFLLSGLLGCIDLISTDAVIMEQNIVMYNLVCTAYNLSLSIGIVFIAAPLYELAIGLYDVAPVNIVKLERKRMAWARKVFPDSTALSSLIHLEKEIREIKYDIQHGIRRPEEYADALSCLFDSAGRQGITPEEIFQAADAKFLVNLSRTWVKNSDGTYSHVK